MLDPGKISAVNSSICNCRTLKVGLARGIVLVNVVTRRRTI